MQIFSVPLLLLFLLHLIQKSHHVILPLVAKTNHSFYIFKLSIYLSICSLTIHNFLPTQFSCSLLSLAFPHINGTMWLDQCLEYFFHTKSHKYMIYKALFLKSYLWLIASTMDWCLMIKFKINCLCCCSVVCVCVCWIYVQSTFHDVLTDILLDVL